MNTKKNIFELNLQIIGGDEIDDADLDQISRVLKLELQDGALIEEENPSKNAAPHLAPKGAKGFDLEVGNLLVVLAVGTIPSLFSFLSTWIKRPGSRPIKIKVAGKNGELELEFDPHSISEEKIKTMALDLQASLKE